MRYDLITIAEFDLSDEAIKWLRECTNAMNEQETSDYVLDLSRTELEEVDQDIIDLDEVAKFIKTVKGLPEHVYEIRVR
ncbi:MAG: hypothetical protein HS126_18855 [Anaerolineales bacterium]|nr:hypothetical protein [Anaerolineales bacterium]